MVSNPFPSYLSEPIVFVLNQNFSGGLSAFAAVHNGVSEPAYLSPSPSPPTTPTDSSEGFSLPNENPCSASSDGPSIIHRAPKSAIEAGGESVIVRLEKGEVSSVHLLGPPSMLMSSDYPCGRHILPMGQTWRGEYWGGLSTSLEHPPSSLCACDPCHYPHHCCESLGRAGALDKRVWSSLPGGCFTPFQRHLGTKPDQIDSVFSCGELL